MAFAKEAGYTNLPNGNFSPTIFSKEVQDAFRKSSVVQDITNSDYFGEIKAFGDTVRIIKEPEITVKNLNRGTQIVPQDLDDEDFTLVVDKANYFAFKMDDIEEAHSHVNWMNMAKDRAAYRLADQFDQEILGYMTGFKRSGILEGTWSAMVAADKSGTDPISTVGTDGLLSSMKLDAAKQVGGTAGNSIAVNANSSASNFQATPLQVINRMKRLLDQQNVPQDGRWLVVDPVFVEQLGDENSKLMNHDYVGRDENLLRNGRVSTGMIRGFKLYESNNLPVIGSGPGTVAASNSTNYGVIVAGHTSAVATAEQLSQTETYRDTGSFADVCRGMQLYGRKLLRPEAIVRAVYNVAG